jgi:hypothetical protein
MHQDGHDAGSTAKVADDSPHLVSCEHHWQANGSARPNYVVQPRDVLSNDVAIEKEPGAQGLILCGSGDVSLGGERAQVLGDLGGAHPERVALAMIQDEATDPGDVALLSAAAVVPRADRRADSIEQAEGLWSRRG